MIKLTLVVLALAAVVSQTEAFLEFRLRHMCYSVDQLNGREKMQSCLDCFDQTLKDEKEYCADAKKCVEQLPAAFQRCLNAGSEAEITSSLRKVQRRFMKHIVRKFRDFWQKFVSEEDRAYLTQFFGIHSFLHKMQNQSAEDFQKVNETVEPCRADYRAKTEANKNAVAAGGATKSKRQADANKAAPKTSEEAEKIDSKEFSELEREIDEAERFKQRIALLRDYMKCYMDKLTGDAAIFEIVKKFFVKYEGNCPSMLVKAIYKDCKI